MVGEIRTGGLALTPAASTSGFPDRVDVNRSLWRVVSIASGLVLTVCGCTGGPARGVASSPYPGDDAVAAVLVDLVRNVDALDARVEVAAEKCVEKKGIAVPSAVHRRDLSTVGVSLDLISWPSAKELAEWRSVGFGIWKQFSEDGTGDDPNRGGLSESEYSQYQKALSEVPGSDRYTTPDGFSVSTTGCLAEARVLVYGSIPVFAEVSSFVLTFQQKIQASLLASREFLEIDSEWSSCMRKSGFEIASLFDGAGYVHTRIYTRGLTESAKAAEIAFASVDASCVENTRYLAKVDLLTSKVAADVYEKNRGQLAGMQETVRSLLERADSPTP